MTRTIPPPLYQTDTPQLVTCALCSAQEWTRTAPWRCRYCASGSGLFESREVVAAQRMKVEREVAEHGVSRWRGQALRGGICLAMIVLSVIVVQSQPLSLSMSFLGGVVSSVVAHAGFRWWVEHRRRRWIDEHPRATRAPWSPWDPMLDSAPQSPFQGEANWPRLE